MEHQTPSPDAISSPFSGIATIPPARLRRCRPVKKSYQSLIFFILLLAVQSPAQVPVPNGDFETPDPTSSTGAQAWKLEMGIDACSLDSTNVWQGKHSLHTVKTNPDGLGFFMQQFPLSGEGLKKYAVTCAIRARVSGEGRVGLGCRIFDAQGNTLCGYLAIRVTPSPEWKVYHGEFYANENAASLRIFGRLDGTVEAWWDGIEVREIPISGAGPTRKADRYIKEYFGLVRTHTILEDTTHLTQLERETRALCAGHPERSYWHNILQRYTTLNLRDGHSFFATPEDWKQMNSGASMTRSGLANFVSGKLLEDSIAYLKVPTYVSLDQEWNLQYVDSAQALIARLEARHPKGWIIDISTNQGGNSFAMLPGLGPLLGNGICGYSRSGDGSQRTRIYRDGWAGWDEKPTLEMRHPPYRLLATDPPIAVIYGKVTGSSGEVVAIAFRGKPNARSFGQPTAGATTRVDNLRLRDGAYLNLACGYDMDRNQVVYKGPVPPDVVTEDWDQAMEEAVKWISEVAGDSGR
jgi:carboxyl-terminal processing protease